MNIGTIARLIDEATDKATKESILIGAELAGMTSEVAALFETRSKNEIRRYGHNLSENERKQLKRIKEVCTMSPCDCDLRHIFKAKVIT